MRTFASTPGKTFHMEFDLLDAEQLLFSATGPANLYVTDGVTTVALVGSGINGYTEGVGTAARFFWLTGFTQLNQTSMITVDSNNNCLRLVDRVSLRTLHLVGQCTNSGFRDGENALFRIPWFVMRDLRSQNKVLVTDSGNNAVRQVDLITRVVTTFIGQAAGLKNFGSMTFDPFEETLLISNSSYIAQYNLTSGDLSSIGGSEGYQDGELRNAKFGFVIDMVFVTNSVVLVADYYHYRVRVVNLAAGRADSICTGVYGRRDGPADSCELKVLYSLLVKDGQIYVGEDESIRTLPCKSDRILVCPCYKCLK